MRKVYCVQSVLHPPGECRTRRATVTGSVRKLVSGRKGKEEACEGVEGVGTMVGRLPG